MTSVVFETVAVFSINPYPAASVPAASPFAVITVFEMVTVAVDNMVVGMPAESVIIPYLKS